jgi:hypothetical protein
MWRCSFLLSLASVLSCALLAQTPDASSTLKLADGTPVKLRMTMTLSPTEAHVGEVVQLEVAEEVSVGDSIVILPGTTASATVVRMDSRKKKAAPHRFALNIDSLNLADGTKALLRGSSEKTQTKDSKSKLLIFTPSSPPYPVLSDQGMILLKDTKVTAYISGDLVLDEKHFPPRKKSPDSAEATVPAEIPVPSQPTELNIFSEPFGAEIDLDGAFIGNTPFRVVVPSGQHVISLRLAGYGPWKKTISAAGGSLEVDANLSPGGINGDVVSHCSTPDCVDSSVSNVAKKPNQKQVRQAPTPPQ